MESLVIAALAPPLSRAATAPARTSSFAARENIVVIGDPAPTPLRLVAGAAMSFRLLPGNRRQILDIAGPGRIFGFARHGRHECGVVALRPSLVEPFDEAAPARDAAMLAEIARLRDLATLLGRKTAMERLASFLVEAADPAASDPQDLAFPVSRQEIADHLGLVIETVSRHFVALKKRGVITPTGRDNIRIEDLWALRRIASGFDAALS